jgi:predicted phage terminase large subunit-like protein
MQNLSDLAASLPRLKHSYDCEVKRRARERLIRFTRYTYPRYIVEPAHTLIADTLDRVVASELDRVMIFAPPQHGKSELASVRLPAFWLGKHKQEPVIVTSYGASLAQAKSRFARDVVESAEYGELFPNVQVRQDVRARTHWELVGGAQVVAAGAGGPLTGHGAKLGIIDDPFENWEQAQSQLVRDRTWDWWRGTFRTRVWDGGAILLIMTRWHEDDLAGRLLAQQADRWTVLRLPAIAETQDERDYHSKRMNLPTGQPDPLGRKPDEPLCPRRFSSEALEQIRADVGSMVWQAEYQAAPTLPEGNRFKRAWFPIVDAVPANVRRVRYWDLAATKDGGARTAGVLLAYDGKMTYTENVIYGQWSTGERNAIMRQTAELDGPDVEQVFEQEPGSSGVDAAKAIIQLLQGFRVYADRPTGSKDTRLEPYAAQAEAGNTAIKRGAWNGAYIEEMCSIPNGRFRDMGDATSGAYNRLVGGYGFKIGKL